MLYSPVYQALSINARKVLDALTVEHIRHARQENGNLMALYDDLAAPPFHVSRRLISAALAELEAGGFVAVARKGRMENGKRQPTRYRLTMYAVLHDESAPTNDWRRRAADDVESARAATARKRPSRLPASSGNVVRLPRNQKPGSPS